MPDSEHVQVMTTSHEVVDFKRATAFSVQDGLVTLYADARGSAIAVLTLAHVVWVTLTSSTED